MVTKQKSKAQLDLLKNIKKAAYLKGDFITRSGSKTDYYIDKYLFETKGDILDDLTDELLHLFPDPSSYDRIAAPELGAVPLAAVLSVKLKKPYIIIKKSSKEYGTQKLIEGAYEKGDRMILIEDILTTGGTALRALKLLKEYELSVIRTIGVIDREEGALQNFAEVGCDVHVLFNKTDLQSC